MFVLKLSGTQNILHQSLFLYIFLLIYHSIFTIFVYQLIFICRASSTAEEREKRIAELEKAMTAAKEEAAAIILQVNR